MNPKVRLARPAEYGLLREIEDEADTMFAEVGIGPFNQSQEGDHLAGAAVVFAIDEPAVGFISVHVVDDLAHIWQVAVRPKSTGRGLGTALIDRACEWARANDFAAITLTTFRDVAWNGPYYQRLGFRELVELSPRLRAIRQHERDIGDDDFGPRIAMRKEIAPTDGSEELDRPASPPAGGAGNE